MSCENHPGSMAGPLQSSRALTPKGHHNVVGDEVQAVYTSARTVSNGGRDEQFYSFSVRGIRQPDCSLPENE